MRVTLQTLKDHGTIAKRTEKCLNVQNIKVWLMPADPMHAIYFGHGKFLVVKSVAPRHVPSHNISGSIGAMPPFPSPYLDCLPTTEPEEG